AQSQVESHLAATILQLIWNDSGCDLLKDYPDQWDPCCGRIRETLEQVRLEEIIRSWKTLKGKIRAGTAMGLLGAAMWCARHPGAIKGYWSHKYHARITREVASECLASLQAVRACQPTAQLPKEQKAQNA
ncbi:MAG: hypothetical protein ACYSTL_07595, partial [Planctomycetota bacterium]